MAAGLAAYWLLRPTDEERIQKQLSTLMAALNLMPSEAPLKRLHQSGTAAECFTLEATVEVQGAGEAGSMQGRGQISEGIRAARMTLQQLELDVRETEIVVDPSSDSAEMKLTVRARVNADPSVALHFLRLQWIKTNSTWLIHRVASSSPFRRVDTPR
ncbi:MAG: hypothetical protein FJ404_14955 [Verrucomicrobia bacterium]|nr:hypothetical protein [Verrucomicrobiota bacterium]